MANSYVLGSDVFPKINFLDRNGAVYDPTTITCTIENRSIQPLVQTVYTYPGTGAWTKISVGVYELQITPATAGDWWVYWLGASTALNEAATDEFTVSPKGL